MAPVDFPMLWLEVAAVALLGVAVALSRRRPLAAAAIPVGLALAATPALFTEQLMVAQLVLSFRLGRRTARARTGLLFFAAVCLAGVLLNVVTPAATLVEHGRDGRQRAVDDHAAVAGRTLRPPARRPGASPDGSSPSDWSASSICSASASGCVERSRIASDMHDSLGHELSLIALRAAALQVDPALDQSARKAAAELRESAAEATQRLHQIISVLREDGDDGSRAAVGRHRGRRWSKRAAAAGMAVTLEGDARSGCRRWPTVRPTGWCRRP